jgi:hypothetical protein
MLYICSYSLGVPSATPTSCRKHNSELNLASFVVDSQSLAALSRMETDMATSASMEVVDRLGSRVSKVGTQSIWGEYAPF